MVPEPELPQIAFFKLVPTKEPMCNIKANKEVNVFFFIYYNNNVLL